VRHALCILYDRQDENFYVPLPPRVSRTPHRPPAPRRLSAGLRLLFVDITPLRTSTGFRWLFLGQIGGIVSRQMLVVAVPFEVYDRTGSTLQVGLVGLVQVAPIVIFSFVGGVIADATDRRTVLVVVEVLMALSCLGFALNTTSTQLWLIYVLIAFNAALIGIESPTKNAVIPSLLEPSQIASAYSLHQSLNQTLQVVGPALAGVIVAHSGIQVSYLAAAACGAVSAVALVFLGARRPSGEPGRLTVGAAVDGWRYLRRVPLLQQIMLIDLSAMVFGMPRALFPAMGTGPLGGNAATVGLLYAAPGAGAMLGALTAGWVPAVRRQGRAIVIAIVVYGLLIAGFGLSRTLPLALLLLALAGAADVVSNVFRSTVLQMTVPDHLRGRVSAFKGALSGSGPRLGDAEAGTIASLTTPTVSIVSGGIVSSGFAVLIAWFGRDIWRQHADEPARTTADPRYP
jgi:predicted MFS family arabinose efflux permease